MAPHAAWSGTPLKMAGFADRPSHTTQLFSQPARGQPPRAPMLSRMSHSLHRKSKSFLHAARYSRSSRSSTWGPLAELLSVSELHERQQATSVEIDTLQAKLHNFGAEKQTLERQLGIVLGQKGHGPKETLKAWDKNNDRVIQRPEFRLAMRTQLHLTAGNVETDALFDKFDADGSGCLDIKELQVSMRLVMQAATLAEHEEAHARTRLDHCQHRLRSLHICLDAAQMVEDAERRLSTLRLLPPLDARVGQVVKAKVSSTKTGSIDDQLLAAFVSQWDVEGGRLGAGSFSKNVQALKNLGELRIDGVASNVLEQIDALFLALCAGSSNGTGESGEGSSVESCGSTGTDAVASSSAGLTVETRALVEGLLEAAGRVELQLVEMADELDEHRHEAAVLQHSLAAAVAAEAAEDAAKALEDKREEEKLIAARAEQARRQERRAQEKAATQEEKAKAKDERLAAERQALREQAAKQTKATAMARGAKLAKV